MNRCGGARRWVDRIKLSLGNLFRWLPSAPTNYRSFLRLSLMAGFVFIDCLLLLKGTFEIIIAALIVAVSGWEVLTIIDMVLGAIQVLISLFGIPVPCTDYQRGIVFLGLGLRLVLVNIIFELIVDTFSNGFRLTGVGGTRWYPSAADWIVMICQYAANLAYVVSSYWLMGTVASLRAVCIAGGSGWEKVSASEIYNARTSTAPQIFLVSSEANNSGRSDETSTRKIAMQEALERSGLFQQRDWSVEQASESVVAPQASAISSSPTRRRIQPPNSNGLHIGAEGKERSSEGADSPRARRLFGDV